MTKQKSLLVIGFSLIAIAMIGGTSAYFAATDRAHNIITTSGVSVELVETAVDDAGRVVPFENIENALPGESYSKIPQVENTDEGSAWVRILPEISATAPDGSPLPVPENALIINYQPGWEKSGNYYYYASALSANETTSPLFTEVTIASDLPDIYQNAKFSLTLTADAVQTANNGSSALTAGGWDD